MHRSHANKSTAGARRFRGLARVAGIRRVLIAANIRTAIRSLGFARVTDNVRETMKSAFNSAIRQGLLERKGADQVWRM